MGDGNEEPQETKIFVARDDRKSSKISDTIVAALIGAIVAGVGVYLQNKRSVSAEETSIERIQAEKETALAAIESAREKVEAQLSFDIRSHILTFSGSVFSSSGTYEDQISAVMRAAVLGGVEGAIDVHTAFRNGATIRALEQIQSGGIETADNSKISLVLEEIPKVLFLDSRLDANIYCRSLEGTGRTNIDAFAPEIRTLPIRMAARSFGPGENENEEIQAILDLIKSAQPDLIVAHLSTFETDSGDNRVEILQDIFQAASAIAADYFPSIILYSRLPRGQTEGVIDFPSRASLLGNENSDRSFFATVALVGDGQRDPDCFLDNSENTRRLRQQIDLALSHQDLYDRGFSD